MNDSADDDELALRSVCHSAKKFTLRYVFLVSRKLLIVSLSASERESCFSPFSDGLARRFAVRVLQGLPLLPQGRALLLPAKGSWGRSSA
jgi:hypothetical protein